MKKRLTLLTSLIVVVSCAVSFLLCAVQVRSQYEQEFKERLNAVLALSTLETDVVAPNPQQAAQQLGDTLKKNGQQIRISIISEGGRVLGDSERKEIDANHLQRPEVQAALHSGRGYDLRRSETTQERYLYAAQKVGTRYIIRAALRTEAMDVALVQFTRAAAICLFVGIVIACAATLTMVGRMLYPLRELTNAAEHISRGDLTSRVAVQNARDEVGRLARSFNRMARSTENAINELDRDQSRLQGLLEGMDDGVLAADAQGQILFYNERMRTLSGTGLTVGASLESGLLLRRIGAVMRQAQEENCPRKEQIAGVVTGQTFTVYAAVLKDGSTQLAVVSDITRMKRLEQMRSEFVGNVTHELKTPLTSIRASIELLKDGDRDEKTRTYFYDVLDMEAERLQRLIDDMLALSRLENMREDPAAQPVNVERCVRNCVERLEREAEQEQVSVAFTVNPKLYVCCAPSRLEQLFTNLIENAIKYNRHGGKVEITGVSQQEIAVVHVRDTGIGIAPEHIPRLFERFYRVDASRSREIGGTGLGLSIVKHIAVLYGGDVSVESRVGEGSTFTVRLPLTAAPEIN